MGPGRFRGVRELGAPKQVKQTCENVIKTMFFDIVSDASFSWLDPEVSWKNLLLGVFRMTHARKHGMSRYIDHVKEGNFQALRSLRLKCKKLALATSADSLDRCAL